MKKYSKQLSLSLLTVILLTGVGYFSFQHFSKKDLPVLEKEEPVSTLSYFLPDLAKEIEGNYQTNLTKGEVENLYNGITMVDVPHAFVENFPEGIKADVTEDQTLFIKIMTAHLLRTNEKIVRERKIVFELLNKIQTQKELTESEKEVFVFLTKKYDVEHLHTDISKVLELVNRVDIIPVSMGVAQAIWVTNWGTKMQKSPFLEHAWKDEKHYEPIEFEKLSQATDSFALQLNTRSELIHFRLMRKNSRVFIYGRTYGFYLLPELANYLPTIPSYTTQLRLVYSLGYIQDLDNACFKDACYLTK